MGGHIVLRHSEGNPCQRLTQRSHEKDVSSQSRERSGEITGILDGGRAQLQEKMVLPV